MLSLQFYKDKSENALGSLHNNWSMDTVVLIKQSIT